MKTHQNCLYVTTQGAYLSALGETVTVRIDGETKLRVPLHLLEGIVCFGRVSMSPVLMGRCAERGIGISFLTPSGRFVARVVGSTSGNVLLRREQYRRADDPVACAELARGFVMAKIANARTVLQRHLRDHPPGCNESRLQDAVIALARMLRTLAGPVPLDTVRGIEGDAARTYFSVFNEMIRRPREEFYFGGRSRRPPRDAVNALLSFVYTLLLHDVTSALEVVGLDPQVGFLHRDRPGRQGLALDLMEELRPTIADRVVLSVINRQQVRPNGFTVEETRGVRMSDETRKTILTAYQQRKSDELRHPFLEEKTTLGLLIHLQARLMARYLRGDLDTYPPFISHG